eukprot:CAMPEP_0119398510 /NCGR_PEP_ID=MMETSP1334-20130426/140883_1 /TAXON_ID=127549 /ORGANISM="Calcidiscus leptoporus, Strain RCC1130" /LENGTH=132 /DNA_ID=CAMNT_0007422377 /DNA_START=731 /DNA_END=1129 /DNA_ORIENTATION=-
MPLIPFLRMMVNAEVSVLHRRGIFAVLLLGDILLSYVALYALFIVYRLTHTLLHKYSIASKFIALKLLVFIAPLQRAVFEALFAEKGMWWECVAYVIESVALAYLLQIAFPPHELPQPTLAGAAEHHIFSMS